MFRVFALLVVALLLAGCQTSTSSSSSDPSATSTTSLTTTTIAEADMDIDVLLEMRAEEAEMPMTDEQLARLKREYTEDELRNGGFAGGMVGGFDGGPCYCKGRTPEDEPGTVNCLCLWQGPDNISP